MKKITYLLLLSCFLSCQQEQTENNSTKEETTDKAVAPTVSEDELWLSLAPYMVPDARTPEEKEQNRIIDYALEKGLLGSMTASGLFYHLSPGSDTAGIRWGDRLQVFYKGQFLDGEVFDAAQNEEKPFEFYVGNMIDGWNEGLQLASPGSELLLIIPSRLAYGKEGLKDKKDRYLIPPDEILVFNILIQEKVNQPDRNL